MENKVLWASSGTGPMQKQKKTAVIAKNKPLEYTSQTITSILYLVSFRCILKEDDLREMIIIDNDEREKE